MAIMACGSKMVIDMHGRGAEVGLQFNMGTGKANSRVTVDRLATGAEVFLKLPGVSFMPSTPESPWEAWHHNGCQDVMRHTMRFGSTAKVLLKCKLKYYRISECNCLPSHMEWSPFGFPRIS